MLVLVLGWTQCLPQGVGAPSAMLRGRTAGFPKKLGGGVGGYNLHSVPPNSPPDCGTVAHQPRAGCIRLVQACLFDLGFNKVSHIFAVCAHTYGSGWLYSILAVQVMWGLFYGGHLCSSRPVSLLIYVSHGVCDVQ